MNNINESSTIPTSTVSTSNPIVNFYEQLLMQRNLTAFQQQQLTQTNLLLTSSPKTTSPSSLSTSSKSQQSSPANSSSTSASISLDSISETGGAKSFAPNCSMDSIESKYRAYMMNAAAAAAAVAANASFPFNAMFGLNQPHGHSQATIMPQPLNLTNNLSNNNNNNNNNRQFLMESFPNLFPSSAPNQQQISQNQQQQQILEQPTAAACYQPQSSTPIQQTNLVENQNNDNNYRPQVTKSHHHMNQEEPKPAHSYIGLIALAILSTPEKRLVLSDIYQWILDNYTYFHTRGSGWRNSIRHNLSLNDCFMKTGRSSNGKGHYWTIHPANLEDFSRGDFRRRRAQRRVRKSLGLTVPEEDEEDDDILTPPSSLSPVQHSINKSALGLIQANNSSNNNNNLSSNTSSCSSNGGTSLNELNMLDNHKRINLLNNNFGYDFSINHSYNQHIPVKRPYITTIKDTEPRKLIKFDDSSSKNVFSVKEAANKELDSQETEKDEIGEQDEVDDDNLNKEDSIENSQILDDDEQEEGQAETNYENDKDHEEAENEEDEEINVNGKRVKNSKQEDTPPSSSSSTSSSCASSSNKKRSFSVDALLAPDNVSNENGLANRKKRKCDEEQQEINSSFNSSFESNNAGENINLTDVNNRKQSVNYNILNKVNITKQPHILNDNFYGSNSIMLQQNQQQQPIINRNDSTVKSGKQLQTNGHRLTKTNHHQQQSYSSYNATYNNEQNSPFSKLESNNEDVEKWKQTFSKIMARSYKNNNNASGSGVTSTMSGSKNHVNSANNKK